MLEEVGQNFRPLAAALSEKFGGFNAKFTGCVELTLGAPCVWTTSSRVKLYYLVKVNGFLLCA